MIDDAIFVARMIYKKYKDIACPPGRMIEEICIFEGIQLDCWHYPNDHFSGMLWEKNKKYIIVYNGNLPKTRKLFTMAHELGHYFLHRYLQPSFFCQKLFRQAPDLREREANVFAAELIMPEEVMVQYIRRNAPIKAIAKGLGVSEEAVRYRVKHITTTMMNSKVQRYQNELL